VPQKIRTMILEIGLRYRPSGQADIQMHMDRLELLMQDVADIPPLRLQTAINAWVAKSPYLPKASDLIEGVRQAVSSILDRAAPSERVGALRRSIPQWNAVLYRERPELQGKAEWRVTDDGQAYIHDLTEAEKHHARFGV
jgi:hypothetical protein